MPRSAPRARTSDIRDVRLRLRLSQTQFAALLGVSGETYRTWDSGRRPVAAAWLDKAQVLAATHDPSRLWSLQELATELGVDVRTLRDAARTGRLKVVYGNQVVFRTRFRGRAWRRVVPSLSSTTDSRTRDSHRDPPLPTEPRSRQIGHGESCGSGVNSI